MTPRAQTLRPGTRCLCLGRVSTKHQAGPDKTSLAQQAEATRAFALALGAEHGFAAAAVEVREDPGVSGLDPERLEEIIATCEGARRPRSAPSFVVVYDMSRFTRLGTQAAMFYLERLERAGWKLRDTTLKLVGTPEAAMADAIQITVACEVAAELIRGFHRKVFPAMAKKADRGEWIGGKPPLGYEVADKRLVPGDAAEVKRVRAAFKAYVGGATLDAVAALLGFPHASSARAVLTNPAYVGEVRWGKRNGSAYHGGKEGAHTPLVDRATWVRAQDRLHARGAALLRRGRATPAGALPYVLSGLVICACGAVDRQGKRRTLVGGGGVPRDATEEERLRWRSYECKACRGSVRQAALEQAVVQAMAGAVRKADADGKLDRWIARWVREQLATGTAAGAAQERATLDAKRARLVRAIAETDDEGLTALLRDVNARIRELNVAAQAKPDARAVKARAADLLKRARAFARQRLSAPEAASQSLVAMRAQLAAIIFDRETRLVEVNFTWHGETETAIAGGRQRRQAPKGHQSGYSASWRVRA